MDFGAILQDELDSAGLVFCADLSDRGLAVFNGDDPGDDIGFLRDDLTSEDHGHKLIRVADLALETCPDLGTREDRLCIWGVNGGSEREVGGGHWMVWCQTGLRWVSEVEIEGRKDEEEKEELRKIKSRYRYPTVAERPGRLPGYQLASAEDGSPLLRCSGKKALEDCATHHGGGERLLGLGTKSRDARRVSAMFTACVSFFRDPFFFLLFFFV